MSEDLSKPEQHQGNGGGVSRRRLMRAGLSAAPVVVALKSNSVLATTGTAYCVKPSTFASLGAAAIANPNASQSPRIHTDFKCFSHGYWREHNTGLVPSNFKTTTKFLSIYSPASPTGFTRNPGGTFSHKTLQQVLEMPGGGDVALARHVTAAYLTARVYPSTAVLSVDDCKNIWNSGGTWSTVAGETWTQARWLEYFDFVLG